MVFIVHPIWLAVNTMKVEVVLWYVADGEMLISSKHIEDNYWIN